MAFYKQENPGDEPLCGPNFVKAPTFELYAEQHATYELPIDGWHWFDTEEEAFAFFGYERPEPTLPV